MYYIRGSDVVDEYGGGLDQCRLGVFLDSGTIGKLTCRVKDKFVVVSEIQRDNVDLPTASRSCL